MSIAESDVFVPRAMTQISNVGRFACSHCRSIGNRLLRATNVHMVCILLYVVDVANFLEFVSDAEI
jgi:hypothetical protein